jgi:pimeloyl-ACP methyl ester carboxylesterase
LSVAIVRGVDIHYRIIGEQGPVFAIIPGARRGYGELASLAEKTAAQGFRVLLHDRRNTGASGLQFDSENVEEVTWADDLYELLGQLKLRPAFIGGSSSGARTAIQFALRHQDACRGLLLLRVTGGAFPAKRLPEMYYEQYIRAAENGGMPAVMATEHYAGLVKANPKSRATLDTMDARRFIAIMKGLRDKFIAGADLPVMGVTEQELASIKVPTLIIPGNDLTHNAESGLTAHRMIKGSVLHDLRLKDEDVALIPFSDWAPYEPEIARAFADFMRKNG